MTRYVFPLLMIVVPCMLGCDQHLAAPINDLSDAPSLIESADDAGDRSAETPLHAARHARPIPSGGDVIAQASGYASWATLAIFAVSVLGVAASFVPAVGQFVDRRSALYGLGVAFALVLGNYVLVRYGAAIGETAFWGVLIASAGAGIYIGWPWLRAWRSRFLAREAATLEAAGEDRAAAAMHIAASPKPLDRNARKAILADVQKRVGANQSIMESVAKLGETIANQASGAIRT